MKLTKYMMTITTTALLLGSQVEAAAAASASTVSAPASAVTKEKLKPIALRNGYDSGDFDGTWLNAQRGNQYSQYYIGGVCEKGGYMVAAAEWYGRAASQGHEEAMEALKRLSGLSK